MLELVGMVGGMGDWAGYSEKSHARLGKFKNLFRARQGCKAILQADSKEDLEMPCHVSELP